jgi:transcriptional regulator with XRE-family HTH domain
MGEETTLRGASGRFAANLRALRQAADLSQEELAFRADIHRTQVSFIEGGHRLPRLDTLVKLSGALFVTPNDLLDGIIWEPSVHRPGRFMLGPEEEGGDDG